MGFRRFERMQRVFPWIDSRKPENRYSADDKNLPQMGSGRNGAKPEQFSRTTNAREETRMKTKLMTDYVDDSLDGDRRSRSPTSFRLLWNSRLFASIRGFSLHGSG